MIFGKKELLKAGEPRSCDQVRMIQKKGWLSQLQLQEIRRLQKIVKIILKLNKRKKTEQTLNLYDR